MSAADGPRPDEPEVDRAEERAPMDRPEEPTPTTRTAGPVPDTPLAGRYRLLESIGTGGVADVYRAIDEALGRPIAVKVFRPGAGPELGERRFDQEVRTLAALHHQHLVTLYDAGIEDGRAYLVLQLVDGTTLHERLREGPLPPAEVARIGAALADALSCVHSHKVMHRDVKPSNVLLDPDGGVYLTDFGIARMVDAPGITASGMLVGTAAYLSPEQVAGQAVERASDVYSLGLVLLECLTGQRVYQGSSVIEVAVSRLSNPPPIPAAFGAGWQALLAAMTAREPADRPTTKVVAVQLRGLADPDASSGSATQPLGAPGTAAAAGVLAAASAGPGTGSDDTAGPGAVDAGAAGAGAAGEGAAGVGDGDQAGKQGPSRRTLVAALAAAAALVTAAFVLSATWPSDPDDSPQTPPGQGGPATSTPDGQGRTPAAEPGSGNRGTGSPRSATPTQSPTSRPTATTPPPSPTGSPTTPPQNEPSTPSTGSPSPGNTGSPSPGGGGTGGPGGPEAGSGNGGGNGSDGADSDGRVAARSEPLTISLPLLPDLLIWSGASAAGR